ncbi:MAG TPA: class IV adenylate cyclase [Terriglobales bacterium]|nr:class IV adenylate cyclase [Terriglobales bacterium]
MAIQETEIKFQVADFDALARKLAETGFHLVTPRTHEMNTLYDFSDRRLRARGELLRLRCYGERWTVTHKAKGNTGRHKSRTETETQVADGEAVASIFASLGLTVSFRYEKFRTEWSDDQGHAVLDETPIGNIAELEGPADWIDQTAAKLGIQPSQYITKSYAQLFFDWREQSGSSASEMTWDAIGQQTAKHRPSSL